MTCQMTMNSLVERHRPEDLLLAALAALSERGVDTLKTTETSFHEHFGRALEAFRGAGGELASLADHFYWNRVTGTYDELDHALITAEQQGFVRFPNPSYSRLQLSLTPKIARRVLNEWAPAEQAVICQAAMAMYRNAHS